MNYKDKELIIFDFDGTLIDSIPDITLAVNKMLSFYNLKPLTLEEVTPFVGNGVKVLVERALKHALPSEKTTKELFEEALEIYTSAYKETLCVETYLYPGVLETLKYPLARFCKACVAIANFSSFILFASQHSPCEITLLFQGGKPIGNRTSGGFGVANSKYLTDFGNLLGEALTSCTFHSSPFNEVSLLKIIPHRQIGRPHFSSWFAHS